ncbi:MAG: penicillin-binding protein 2, partial [Bacteroidaceae bacterium]|nr:penicillin-binding protein 2 [Bacteroidaceae bacterium]
MSDPKYEYRKFVIGGIVLLIVITYSIRLAYLQLMCEDYKVFADSNAFLNNVIFPARGVIYDRNGDLLVYNQPAYDIMVVMREVENLDTLDFCSTLDITKDEFIQRMNNIKDRNKNPGYSSYTHQIFMGQIRSREFSVFQEKLFRFKGFYLRERNVRR